MIDQIIIILIYERDSHMLLHGMWLLWTYSLEFKKKILIGTVQICWVKSDGERVKDLKFKHEIS